MLPQYSTYNKGITEEYCIARYNPWMQFVVYHQLHKILKFQRR
jgi:hypothetical protein